MKKNIKVILARIDPPQKNTASYNRDLAIEKMVKSSFDCELVIPEFPVSNMHNRIISGLISRLRLILSIRRALTKTDAKSNNVLFLRSIDPFVGLITWILVKSKNIKLAIERNELPAVIINGKTSLIKIIIYKYFVLSWHYRLFNVLFLMTDELINFYGKYTGKSCIIKKLPMTVDFSRFELKKTAQKSSYVFYAGSLLEQKDGVESLIHAFRKISEVYPDINLKIAGGSKNGEQEKKLMNLINDYRLQTRISLLGFIIRDKIPDLLCSAKMLVLARPDSMQARGGFPTKLGEYLAASVPVIVTRVGEISRYLSEDEVFFISPDNIVDDLYEKIKYILSNYDRAMQVAYRGKRAAKRHFSLENNKGILKQAFEAVFTHPKIHCSQNTE